MAEDSHWRVPGCHTQDARRGAIGEVTKRARVSAFKRNHSCAI